MHAVGLNFKDVLNVLLSDRAAYVGYDTPPLPGSDFAGVVIRVDTESQFVVGEKVYGLSI